MKYAVEMGSSAMTYIPRFRHSKVGWGEGDTQTHRQHGYLIRLLSFFKESALKMLKFNLGEGFATKSCKK
jgi:hypothetical protein